MLNRVEQPLISKIEKIQFLEPKHFAINNDVSLHWVKEIDDESVKIDLVFNAGSKNDKCYIAPFVNSLLLSGTKTKSSIEINSAIDELGGFFQTEASKESAVISIYGLRKNIRAILEIVFDAILNVNFPDSEIELLRTVRKQKFKVAAEKVSTIARRAFTEGLFGGTKYGEITNLEDYDTITREEVVAFHEQFYLKGLMQVSVVANLEETEIIDLIAQVKPMCNTQEKVYVALTESKSKEVRIEKEGAIQSAIRVGRILFNRTEKDYLEFAVLNTILGGYFGSRLMSNIREDKGYTYGIGSGVMEMKELGYFFISTEVGKDVTDATLKEIQFEIKRLQTELVSNEELDLVRNYSIGQVLKSSDGPNAMMDIYLGLEQFGLNYAYYDEIINTFNNITADQIKALAKKYLNWEDMLVVVAG